MLQTQQAVEAFDEALDALQQAVAEAARKQNDKGTTATSSEEGGGERGGAARTCGQGSGQCVHSGVLVKPA